MKIMGVLGIGAGCCLGMLDALSRLSHDGSASASIEYLNTLSLAFQIDGLSAFFLLAIFAVCLLAAIYSFHYMNDPEKALRTATSYFFFSLLAASMALVVVAANMITFMLSWEIMSLSSFFLVIYDHQTPENRKAGYLYFVFSHVGPCLFLRPSASCTATPAVSDLNRPDSPTAAKTADFRSGLCRLRLQGRRVPLSCLAAPCPPGGPLSHLCRHVRRDDQNRHLRHP
jgi:NADH:ubiquinone oxidoreductase subunit 5 (subunit L)/multisubunit Na+/H+ antiporter MnhA subunit